MTVVATDGERIVADTLGSSAGARVSVSKLRTFEGGAIGISGRADAIDVVAAWAIDHNCDPEKRPDVQDTEDWCRGLILRDNGKVELVEQFGKFEVLPPVAIGSGQDFALAGMALGLNAAEAVELTCRLATGCGMPSSEWVRPQGLAP